MALVVIMTTAVTMLIMVLLLPLLLLLVTRSQWVVTMLGFKLILVILPQHLAMANQPLVMANHLQVMSNHNLGTGIMAQQDLQKQPLLRPVGLTYQPSWSQSW
jgi:hypothetical protein